jgi:anaerobic selenocysteine-containing dehydrogenase/ferredoxin-NADP reductase
MTGVVTRRLAGYCTLCKSNCGCVSVVRDERLIAIEPLTGHPTGGALCAKGRAMPELTHSPKRLLHPMRRTAGKDSDDPGWVPISWDEALDEIAERLRTIRRESGAESVAFAVTTSSGTPMVDGTGWVNHFIRHFGSPNIVYATEICGWHKNFAHAFTFGQGIGTPDYRNSELIILWGHNPARTWLSQATAIAEAHRDGATVVVIDPRRGGSGQLADQWLRIRPGTDGALALGAVNDLINTAGVDEAFVRRWTNAPLLVDVGSGELLRSGEDYLVWDTIENGPRSYDTRFPLARPETVALRGEFQIGGRTAAPVFETLAAHVAEWTIARVADTTWIDRDALSEFYTLLQKSRRVSYYSWTGLGQHTNATQTERALSVLYALLGCYDEPGGIRWVAKHAAAPLGAYSILPRAQQRKALGYTDMPLGPPAQGHITARDFRRAVLDGEPYRVRAMIGFGSNMVVSQGAADENRRALRALEFQVHCDMFENPTATTADILLPVCAPPEREGVKIGFDVGADGEELVQLRQAVLPPSGESRSDYDIVFALATRLGMADEFFGGDLDAGWNHHLAPLGLTVQQLRRHPEGIRVPIEQHDRKYSLTSDDGTVAGFATPTRRVELHSELMREVGQPTLPTFTAPDTVTPGDSSYPYVLTTAKNPHFTHSSLRSMASLRRRSPDPTVELSPALAAERGLVDGDWATIATPDGAATLRVRIDGSLHPKVVVAEHGWWDDSPPPATPGLAALGSRTSNLNAALSDRRRDPVSGSVPLRAVACDVRRDDRGSAGHWAGWRTFRVTDRQPVENGAVALTLRPVDADPVPEFRPGQHVRVRSSDIDVQRAYSLISPSATATGDLRIAVKNIGGRMSGHLHRVDIERDMLELTAPSGVFTMPVGGTRTVLCIGGGIGVTPFLGYLESLAGGQPSPREVRVMYSCRETPRESSPMADRLIELADRLPRVTLHHRGGATTPRLSVDDISVEFLASRPRVYLCGPEAMMSELTEQLVAAGLDRFDITTEEFFSDIEIPSTLTPATVRFARTGRELTWTPQSGSLLDAADRAGIPLGSGCRTGACESCLVTVRAGEVAHLTAVQNDPGTCLSCQAIPLGDVELDA